MGSVDHVRKGLQAFFAETGVDDLMIVSDVYHHDARLRSVELIAEAMKRSIAPALCPLAVEQPLLLA
ncbi:hypothetical protein ASD54_21955 [Rhizobium sp. Root149]|uniref:hypothetical protein n=1 Tax=Rhizobium sp. Root149 TaxID=1736473 RepID=UPI000714E89C|nr:hypothetical protein [Rhizobium sp. Root149]KQZ46674.1 hypothetical protein ASD54_21955 [Rhizobium sp. Root149]